MSNGPRGPPSAPDRSQRSSGKFMVRTASLVATSVPARLRMETAANDEQRREVLRSKSCDPDLHACAVTTQMRVSLFYAGTARRAAMCRVG